MSNTGALVVIVIEDDGEEINVSCRMNPPVGDGQETPAHKIAARMLYAVSDMLAHDGRKQDEVNE